MYVFLKIFLNTGGTVPSEDKDIKRAEASLRGLNTDSRPQDPAGFTDVSFGFYRQFFFLFFFLQRSDINTLSFT